jgi:hypothetical protein
VSAPFTLHLVLDALNDKTATFGPPPVEAPPIAVLSIGRAMWNDLGRPNQLDVPLLTKDGPR